MSLTEYQGRVFAIRQFGTQAKEEARDRKMDASLIWHPRSWWWRIWQKAEK